MSVSGLCEICERPDVDHTCDRCGRLVCDRHFDRETNRCTECAAELRRPDSDQQPTGDDMPDGVDTYRF
ncbi:MAG: hypothetical protein ABEH35_05265 [Haloarculaceae archaeon]